MTLHHPIVVGVLLICASFTWQSSLASAQTAPSKHRIESYRGLHKAAHNGNVSAIRDLNALDNQAYDIVTIAAVDNDFQFMELALSLGAKPGNVTSPYEGTALIAAAHLGHYEVVKRLIAVGAPLNHVNNLGWTALIEAVILGDGGPNHVKTVSALVAAGADKTISDRNGVTPLAHAQAHGYTEIIQLLK